MTPGEILRAAKAKIEKPENWCQGALGLTRGGDEISGVFDLGKAQRVCSIGAVGLVHGLDWREMLPWLLKAIDGKYAADLISFNDEHDHPTVLAMFDRAIALAEQEDASNG